MTDYVPTKEDILSSRFKTVGKTNSKFEENGIHFVVNDLGGDENEVRKWDSCTFSFINSRYKQFQDKIFSVCHFIEQF